MRKTVFSILFVLCCSISVFSQKGETLALSDKIVNAIEQKLPGWSFSRYPKLLAGSISGDPVFLLQIKDNRNRSATVTINLIETTEAKESRFRMYFIRAIMPPDSSKIENFVEKGFMVGTANSVDALFSKANLMIDIDASFPRRSKVPKLPHYYLPAPAEEKEKILKIVELIAGAIVGDVTLDECRNTFFRYRAPPGETPENRLLIAAANGDPDEIAALLRQNVDPNARIAKDMDFGSVNYNEGNTALHFAARQGCGETVAALISAKADVNAVNARGETPLMFAAYLGKTETARLLIAANADLQMESFGRNAAFFVMRAQETITVFDARTERRIEQATANARVLLNDLAGKGLDLTKKDSRDGNTLLTALLSSARGKFAHDMTQTLLERGVDPNEANNSGNTPLLILANAPSDNIAEMMKVLIAKGADVNKPDKNNQTPLRVLLKKQIEFKTDDVAARTINEAIAVLVNAGAKE